MSPFTYLGYGDFKIYKLPTYATESTKQDIMPLKRVIVLKLTKEIGRAHV